MNRHQIAGELGLSKSYLLGVIMIVFILIDGS
jgi:hypothetical protein